MKQGIINHCRGCNRYNGPPWMAHELESNQLLTMLLKKIKGLKQVKLVEAKWVWTEAHSRRLKIELTIQKEIISKTLLQKKFLVEFEIINLQCEDCKKTFTPHIWTASVQVRQKVNHKRTFLFLEQLILATGAADKAVNIKEVDEGIDFYFKNKSHAN